MTRLTIAIPASRAAAVNAALGAINPEAAGTFNTHPALDTEGTPDTTVMVASWDLDATGHEDLAAAIAQAIETTGRTGTGKTAKTATIRVGDDPVTAVKIAAADLEPTPLDADQ